MSALGIPCLSQHAPCLGGVSHQIDEYAHRPSSWLSWELKETAQTNDKIIRDIKMFPWDRFDMLQWWSVYDSESPPPRPLFYLEEAGSVGRQAAVKVSYQDESHEIPTKRGLAINDEMGPDSWGCGSQKHHCPRLVSEYFKVRLQFRHKQVEISIMRCGYVSLTLLLGKLHGGGWFSFSTSYLWYMFRNQNLVGQ